MRCPKCGYISFDRQKSCGKCSNDLTAVAEQLQGTVGKAASPFFLGAILGKQESYAAEPGPALHEEEEPLDLDELEADAPPADEDELDFAGTPLDEDELEDQALPSLGLEDIDVSDLMPPQEEDEEEELVLHLGNEQKETILTQVPAQDDDEQEDSLSGIEFSGFDTDETLNVDEEKSPLDDLDYEAAEPQSNTEEDEIIDLSSLMSFDEPPAKSADREEDHDILELSLGDAPEDLHLSIEDDESATPSPDAAKKPAGTVADIADLGLTLENDDQ
ncbi:MAG: hypothetical protein NTW42_04085 [Deltaproteobacteria bacterium]|nr:hypothetical protein [Deltaproteobacteria bacterium]